MTIEEIIAAWAFVLVVGYGIAWGQRVLWWSSDTIKGFLGQPLDG